MSMRTFQHRWSVVPAIFCSLLAFMLWLDPSLAQQSSEPSSGSAPASICTPLAADLISWWRAENNGHDAIGFNDGTMVGGVRFAAGEVGKAFHFNGSNYVSVPNSASLNLPNFSSWTIQAWAFRTDSSWPQHLAGKRQGCGGGDGFYQLAFGTNDIPPSSVPINRWVHLASTADGKSGVFNHYVNGSLVASYLFRGWRISNSAPFLIGTSGTCAGFRGFVDEVSLYDRALSPAEINAVYLAGHKGQCVPQGVH